MIKIIRCKAGEFFMTLKEKLRCGGQKFLGKPGSFRSMASRQCLCVTDRTRLRKQEHAGDHLSAQVTARYMFSIGSVNSLQLDVELVGKIGSAIAEEALDQGVGLLLGPGVNIKRICLRKEFRVFFRGPVPCRETGGKFYPKRTKKRHWYMS